MLDKKISIGIKYDSDVPFVIAKGLGKEADIILEIAKRNDIPLFEDPELAEYLSRFQAGEAANTEFKDVFKSIIEFLIILGRKY